MTRVPVSLTGAQLRELVHGASEVVEHEGVLQPLRVPSAEFPRFPDPAIGWVVAQTAGVRLRMRTSATSLRLRVHCTRNLGTSAVRRPVVLTAESDGIPVWRGEDDGGDVLLGLPHGGVRQVAGEPATFPITLPPGADKLVEIRLPHRAQTRLVSLEADAAVRAVRDDRPRWTHYGSSISHGHEVDAPGSVWTHQVARRLGWNLTDRAFSGNAMLDSWAAAELARAPADLITAKVGINIVADATMRERVFVPAVHAFLDIVRAAHPGIPIRLISAVTCVPLEECGGPLLADTDGAFRSAAGGEGSLTLVRSRELLAQVVRCRRDPDLAVLDGRRLLGAEDAGLLGDGLHPVAEGHDRMAARAVPLLRDLLPAPSADRPSTRSESARRDR